MKLYKYDKKTDADKFDKKYPIVFDIVTSLRLLAISHFGLFQWNLFRSIRKIRYRKLIDT